MRMRTSNSKSVTFVVISLLVIGTLGLSYSTSAIAVPPERIESCKPAPTTNNSWECCWTEIEEGDAEQIEIYLCQYCTVVDGVVECGPPEPDYRAPPTTGENIVPGDIGVLEKPPTPPPFDPTAPLQGGVFEQQPQTPPPSGPAAPLQGGVLEQLEQGEGAAPPFVPGFLERQEQQPPADQGTGSEVPRTAEPLPPTCTPGSVFDPDINECVLENPPELCPDGSIPQSGGPGGMQPECPPSEAEEPQAEEPEQPAAKDPEQQQSTEEGDGSSEDNSNNN